ncbi:MAG: hypothetical protein ABIR24_03945 [Verrucomicrobiota bacterium]
MSNSRISFAGPLAWLGCFLLMTSFGASKLAAADPRLEVQLVWGTNDDSSPDPKHKPLEASLVKKLGMFKWKNYFTVNRKDVLLALNAAQKIQLSPQCEIEIKHLGSQRYEINVFGQKKHVKKITEKITRQDSLTIAGDDKNDCAWIILIREI